VARSRAFGVAGDGLTQRAAEMFEDRERAGRLGRALARLSSELADARREIAVLKRENAALQRRLARVDRGSRGSKRR
jgi:hypothetical protein